MTKKKLMETQNPSGTQNERSLWCSPAPDTVDTINAHGFNRSYCHREQDGNPFKSYL